MRRTTTFLAVAFALSALGAAPPAKRDAALEELPEQLQTLVPLCEARYREQRAVIIRRGSYAKTRGDRTGLANEGKRLRELQSGDKVPYPLLTSPWKEGQIGMTLRDDVTIAETIDGHSAIVSGMIGCRIHTEQNPRTANYPSSSRFLTGGPQTLSGLASVNETVVYEIEAAGKARAGDEIKLANPVEIGGERDVVTARGGVRTLQVVRPFSGADADALAKFWKRHVKTLEAQDKAAKPNQRGARSPR